MGRVRTKTVKKSSRQVIEKYYSRMTLDFHTNKKLLEEVAIIPTKLQEEERERRMGFVPAESAIKTDSIAVDPETIETEAPAAFPARGGARRY